MHKKSLTFGVGTGILAMTLMFYFIYNIQLSKYKKSFQDELALQKQQIESEFSKTEPKVKEVPVQLTDTEIIEKAMQLGMVFEDQPLVAEPQNAGGGQRPRAAVLSSSEDYAVIEIKEGNVSSEISEILYKSGVIDSASAFNDFLNKTGNAKKLAYGTFTIPKNLSYEEVAEIIKSK